MKKVFSWPERLRLMEVYHPTDAQVCSAFGVSLAELATARQLTKVGAFVPATNMDVSPYSTIFNSAESSTPTVVQEIDKIFSEPVVDKPRTRTVHPRPVIYVPPTAGSLKPETATKRVKPPQKRGRKGNGITNALLSVPHDPTPVLEFAQTHGVSVAVLRQSKRFIANMDEKTATRVGIINVRQDKETKVLMIWREDKGE